MVELKRTDITGMEWGAVFSDDRKFRFRLWRYWGPGPRALYVLMNASLADHHRQDPTAVRQMARTMSWSGGYGGIDVCNAYGWIEPYSGSLVKRFKAGEEIIGAGNDEVLYAAARAADIVVVGWGTPGALGDRDRDVMRILRDAGATPHCLGVNDDGTPVHPLYQKYDLPLIPYHGRP